MLRRSENNGDYYSSKDRQILVVNVVQTSDLSWEFLKIENKQLKTVQNHFMWIKLAWNWPLIFV